MDVNRFLSAVRDEPSSAGFLIDMDGTLAPIVPQPEMARPVDAAAPLLARLAQMYGLVAILSGRRAEFLEQVIRVPGVALMGLYGSEISIDGVVSYPPGSERLASLASRIARDAQAFISAAGLQGCEVEYKELTVSVHYRNAKDVSAARQALSDWGSAAAPKRGFVFKHGRMVVELTPAGISKAHAAEQMLDRRKLRRVLYAGDDTADVEAMKLLKSRLGTDGLTVGVVSGEQPEGMQDHADVLVRSPSEVVEFLVRFA